MNAKRVAKGDKSLKKDLLAILLVHKIAIAVFT
jgi:hypothetical protein